MIRKQFFIKEDQEKRLKALALKLGVKESELIRDGIDRLLAEKENDEEDWKAGLLQAAGIWKDRDDLAELDRQFRDSWNRRFVEEDDVAEDRE